MGIEENLAGALAYLLGFLTGIFFLATEDDNKFVRFHAAQSTVVFGVLFILSFILSFLGGGLFLGGFSFGMISMIMGLVSTLLTLIIFVLWLYLMYMAYQGNKVRVPIAANMADNLI